MPSMPALISSPIFWASALYSTGDIFSEKTAKTFPPVGGRIQLLAQQLGNTVSVNYRVNLDKMMILPENYADLRLFWETAVGVEKSTIVLRKQ